MNHAAIHACGTCTYEPGPGAFAAPLLNCRHEITITGGVRHLLRVQGASRRSP